MKILQIFPGKVWGGAEQYVLDLGRALTKRGHQVSYLCENAEAVTSRLDSEHIPYRTMPSGGLFTDAGLVKWLAGQMHGTDITHIHDSRFVPLLSKARNHAGSQPRLVFTRHIARGSRVLPWHRKHYLRLGALIFVSHLAYRMWHEANPWMPRQLCHTLHNSIPELAGTGRHTTGLRETYGIDRQTPLLVFTGRVRKSKGCRLAIEALASLPDDLEWAMVFIGAGKPADYPDRLKAIAMKAGIGHRVHFHGYAGDTRRLIRECDIGIQPSIVREAFGLSQLEFMQAGKPVITTTNGAQSEYITDGVDGILIPPSVDSLATAIGHLLRSPQLRTSMGQNAAARYRQSMNYNNFIDRILKIYQQT